MDNRHNILKMFTATVAAAIIPAFAARRPLALVIMVDGMRADAVQSGEMPRLERLRAGKWQAGYRTGTCAGLTSPR